MRTTRYSCIPASIRRFGDYNFWGRSRNNITTYRQTQFVVHLMDGTDFGVVDPRMSRMLAPSPDGAVSAASIRTSPATAR